LQDYYAMRAHSPRSISLCGLLFLVLCSVAAAGQHGHGCPTCGCKVCQPVPGTVKEKKHCWEVECKEICIPLARLPWEPCCAAPKCGKVKTVKVLKKIDYECEKCGYKWEVLSAGCAPCGSCAK
jgi:hypothetical protein